MNMANVGTIEGTMMAEYLRNYIGGQLSDFLETNAKEIERVCSCMSPGVGFKRELNQIVDEHIVQPYIAFIENLVREVNGKLGEFFRLPQTDMLQPKFPNLFRCRLDEALIGEYVRTEMISGTMEKLINKTFDFACLNRSPIPFAKNFFDPLSVGGLILCTAGLDRSSFRSSHRQELGRKLQGIGKNVNKRALKLLITQYTAFIHRKTAEAQTLPAYEQAI